MGIENRYTISPALNNVIFASSEYSFMFSIESMVEKYKTKFPSVDDHTFKKILWGDYYFDPEKKKFGKKAFNAFSKRTFV